MSRRARAPRPTWPARLSHHAGQDADRGAAWRTAQEILFLPSGSSSKPAFTIPLALLSNTVLSTKTEVVLDLKPSLDPLGKAGGDLSDAVDRKKQIKNGPDEVVEIRFYIPGATESKTKKAPKVKAKKEEGVDKMEVDGEDEDDSSDVEEDGKEPESAAQAFFDTLKEKSDMGQEMGEALGVVSDVNCLTPRGKFGASRQHFFLCPRTAD